MNWNQNVLLLVGVFLGATVCAVSVALFQSSGSPFDLEAAGKFATILVAPFTLGLVALSWVLARETRQTWVQNRIPNVIVTIESTRVSINHMDLVIENVGGGPAYDLRIAFDPDLDLRSSRVNESPRMISSVPLLTFPILKPHQRLTTYLGAWWDINPKRARITVTCKDASGVTHPSINEIDLTRFEGTGGLGTEPLVKIGNEIAKIGAALEQLASGFRRLNVDVHTAAERNEEEREREAWIAEQSRPDSESGPGSETAPSSSP